MNRKQSVDILMNELYISILESVINNCRAILESNISPDEKLDRLYELVTQVTDVIEEKKIEKGE